MDRGLTLVEVLVVIAIIAILLASLLPAVMDSRRAADRARCANQLKLVELATLAFHDSFNFYPPYFKANELDRGYGPISHYYSVFSHILPFLDQQPLFNQINFQAGIADQLTSPHSAPIQVDSESPANLTVMTTAIASLFCPSDPAAIGGSTQPKGSNYRANYGTSVGYTPEGQGQCGPFTFWTLASTRDVKDGLSQTASYSEKPRGAWDRANFLGFVDSLVEPNDVTPPARIPFQYCVMQDIVAANYRTTTATNWLVGGLAQTCYNHMVPPNGTLPDCVLLGYYPGEARATARSFHAAGANLAMADGSVRFVAASINPATWAALGSRAGEEVISSDSW